MQRLLRITIAAWLALPGVGMDRASGALAAQETAAFESQRGPQFLYATTAKTTVPLDVARVPLLRQRLALDLQGISVKDALAQIAGEAGIVLWYSDDVLRRNTPVHLRAQNITVAAALTDVLMDAGVDVVFSRDGTASLVKRVAKAALPAVGVVTGRVIDSTTSEGISDATVAIEGTRISTITGFDGRYTLRGIPTGTQRVTARRFGYRRGLQSVAVVENAESRVDFVLARAPTVLSDVVTTATGERERLEVGNAIGTIKADSIVPTTLIRNMSDLLQARVAGVVVTNSSGLVGSPSRVRLRGVSSLSLNNDPVVIIDGIRVNAGSTVALNQTVTGSVQGLPDASGSTSQLARQLAPSRMDDIDPNTIESIDILRGPSASSLYGTDAANGVIIIKTKRGRAGPWRIDLSGDQQSSAIAGKFPEQWFGWGAVSGSNEPISNCVLATGGLETVVNGGCVQDSVTHFNAQNDPDMRTIGTGTTQALRASLSGGTQALQQFLSLSAQSSVGMARMSRVQERIIADLWGTAPPPWMRRPNAEQSITGSSRTTFLLSPKASVSLTSTGVYRDNLNGGSGIEVGTWSSWRGKGDTLRYLPSEPQRAKQTSLARRGVLAASGTYSPRNWVTLTATVGGDYTLRTDGSDLRAQDCTFALQLNAGATSCPSHHIVRNEQTFVTTANLGASLKYSPRPWLDLRTSIGEQYSRTSFYSLEAGNGESNLAFGTRLLTPNPVPEATNSQLFSIAEAKDASASAGWYVEQSVGIWGLYTSFGLREDVASAFGSDANRSPPRYPKFSFSYPISDRSFFPTQPWLQTLRLRLAYGHSGTQASQAGVHNQYQLSQNTTTGPSTPTSTITLTRLGNPDLRPERGKEWEGGFDASFFDNDRVTAEVTMYRKYTKDAIIREDLAPSFGVLDLWRFTNLGDVVNRGVELSTSARLLDTPDLEWALSLNYSRNNNKLVRKSPSLSEFGLNFTLNREGFPLFGYWSLALVSYADLNGDGILAPSEITFGPPTFMGAPYPESEITYGSNLSVLRGMLRFNVSVNQVNGRTNIFSNGTHLTRGAVDPSSSLAEQAAWIQSQRPAAGCCVGYVVRASTVRLNELSATLTVPDATARRLLGARSTTITLAGRNLGLWTNYIGKDPNMSSDRTSYSELDQDYGGGLPQPRTFAIRLGVGF